MAEAIADALDNHRMVVFAGNGHIAYKFGIPDRVHRRSGASFRTLMPVTVGAKVKRHVADYIWVTPPHMPKPRRVIVGIRLKANDQEERVLIEEVVEESPAERAGIKAQDVLLAIDARPVSGLMDVHTAVAGSKGARTHLFKIERQGEILELTVRLD